MSSSAEHREFLALVDTHGAAVMALLRRLCRNRHDADEVFQETALRVWRSFPTRPRLRNPRAWLMTIAYRTSLNHLALRRLHAPYEDSPDDRSMGPASAAEQAETCGRVQAAIGALADPLREVIILHYVGGMSLRETAVAMDLSVGTVKSRLNAALTKLRSSLE